MHLFCYGTLMHPDVFTAVTNHSPDFKPASLAGYRRYAIRGTVYPGIAPEKATSTAGVTCELVNPDMLRRLDAFESSFYAREKLTVITDDREIEAWAYVVKPRNRRRLANHDWSYEEFVTAHLKNYLANIRNRSAHAN